MISDRIEDLYANGEISGRAYLGCIERDLLTISDVMSSGLIDDNSCSWISEFRELFPASDWPSDKLEKESSEEIVEDHSLQAPVVFSQIDLAKKIYNELLVNADKRVVSALDKMAERYPSFPVYLHAFLSDEWGFWHDLLSLRSYGTTTVTRAQALSVRLNEELRNIGIDYHDLVPIEHPDTNDNSSENKFKDDGAQIDKFELRSIVEEELSRLSVRSKNALLTLLLEENNDILSFYEKITSSSFLPAKIKNVGRKSVPEIKNFVKIVSEQVKEMEGIKPEQEIITEEIPDDIERFLPVLEAEIETLSVRSKHAIEYLFNKCGRSVRKFLETVKSPAFRATELPAIGKKCAGEISLWINHLSSEISAHRYSDPENTESFILLNTMRKVGIRGNLSRIDEASSSIGHFAFFAAIDEFLKELDHRDSQIIEAQLKIYQGQQITNRKEAAKVLGISPERARQLRIKLFNRITIYVSGLPKRLNVQSVPYKRDDYLMVNQLEGTIFNENFYFWVLSLIDKAQFKLFGDPEASFSNPYGYEVSLAVVPKRLDDIFDFKHFIKYFADLLEDKRVEDVHIELKTFVQQYFKGRIYFEFLDEVVEECSFVLNKIFHLTPSYGDLTIEKNSERNNPELVEMILREAGRPLTIEEIFSRFEERYPGRSKSQIALSGSLRNNPKISTVGRSSTYTLKEWVEAEHRGGTIREFATEFLLSLEEPIATVEAIGSYVRRYRPTASDKSIHSNLLAEASGAFALFYDEEGGRCIGLSNYDYKGSYRKFEPAQDSKRTFKTSCTLLEEFVALHKRLPFSSGDASEEEKRLSRFWGIQVSRLAKGELEGEEKDIIESMAERFAIYKIHKREYDWQSKYGLVKKYITEGRYNEMPNDLEDWINHQFKSYKTLSQAHKDDLTNLIKLLSKNNVANES